MIVTRQSNHTIKKRALSNISRLKDSRHESKRKRKPSAYIKFVKTRLPEIKNSIPDLTGAAAMSTVRLEWQSLKGTNSGVSSSSSSSAPSLPPEEKKSAVKNRTDLQFLLDHVLPIPSELSRYHIIPHLLCQQCHDRLQLFEQSRDEKSNAVFTTTKNQCVDKCTEAMCEECGSEVRQ